MFVDVVALRPLASGAEETLSGKSVAAGFGDEVDQRATDFALTEAARQRQLHFLRIGGIDDVPRRATTVECRTRAQAVNIGATFVAASPMTVEDAHRGHQVDLVAAARDRWHEEDQGVIPARRG